MALNNLTTLTTTATTNSFALIVNVADRLGLGFAAQAYPTDDLSPVTSGAVRIADAKADAPGRLQTRARGPRRYGRTSHPWFPRRRVAEPRNGKRPQNPGQPRLPLAGPELRHTGLTATRGVCHDGREVRCPLA
jgi:hypothetical protein